MNKTNLAYSNKDSSWNLPEWNYLVREISKVFRFTDKEKNQFEKNFTAKIIATIPFEAGCNEPERTAIAHLCLYVAEKRGFQEYCSHLPSDDYDIYNPLVSGKWNYQVLKNKLLWEITKIQVPNIDWIFTYIPLNYNKPQN